MGSEASWRTTHVKAQAEAARAGVPRGTVAAYADHGYWRQFLSLSIGMGGNVGGKISSGIWSNCFLI